MICQEEAWQLISIVVLLWRIRLKHKASYFQMNQDTSSTDFKRRGFYGSITKREKNEKKLHKCKVSQNGLKQTWPSKMWSSQKVFMELNELRRLSQSFPLVETGAELETGPVSGYRLWLQWPVAEGAGGQVSSHSLGLPLCPRERRVRTESRGRMLACVRHSDGCPGAPLTSALGGFYRSPLFSVALHRWAITLEKCCLPYC